MAVGTLVKIGSFLHKAGKGLGMVKNAVDKIDDKTRKDIDTSAYGTGEIKMKDVIDDDKIKVRV